MGKDMIRGDDPMARFDDENWQSTAFDIADRTGMFTYLAPALDSALKAPIPATGGATLGSTLGVTPSRFKRNDNFLDSMLGANFALFRDIQRFGAALGSSDGDRIKRKGALLLPFNTQLRLMMRVQEGLQE